MIPLRLKAKRGNKNKSVLTVVDGITFQSGAEARRYGQLSMLQRAGLISDLKAHPKFSIKVNDIDICSVLLDFSYVDTKTGKTIIEDVKGLDNSTSRLKRKLVEAIHSFKVVIIKMPRARVKK